MDLLVTGGCGYIGSALVPLLCEDDRVDRVVVLDDLSTGSPRNLLGCVEAIDFRQGDVREYGDVESSVRGVDGIVHLAAITGADSTHDRREETYATNLEGTRNVLTAAGKIGVGRVVVASSCNIYGRATSTDIDETVDPDPINPYAETKHESEQLLREYTAEYDMDGTAIRLSTVYGDAPGIRFNLVVNQFVFRALTGRPLTVYGDGSNWRPFIHVRDAARAYRDAVLRPGEWSKPVYNVGTNDGNYRIADVATLISEEIDTVDVTYLEDEHPGPSYHVNFDRLDETGFEPEYTLREGVRELAGRFTG
ncbi:NAD-dependent epimerase/dehydratase family protein [Halococcus saccharolyticus]|uniref:UDP-glucose 4-epimerase n=1 Tax=Halococcus saccharolyticus DSM 5350 TaxID=1227455 RepID=M0MQE5_9EURY|nr:NAD(P)-dependent oxidoreductase [Halococcus saccharolyticus]EMA46964.1 UDP-glucose 4-epimerase [Halococcus saccharolyticus DSM 5350]